MKEIELKIVPIGKSGNLSYKKQIEEIVRTPTEGGVDYGEMRKAIRLLDALEDLAEDGVLELEDADYDYLRARVGKVRWPVIDKAIIQFVQDVTGISPE